MIPDRKFGPRLEVVSDQQPMQSITVKRLSDKPDLERGYWAAIREICCLTGDNGRPIAATRRQFFARIWIEPYQRLLPHWTYAAVDGDEVVGYLTGCPDSAIFYRQRTWRCSIPLLIQIGLGRYRNSSDARNFARRTLRMEKSVAPRFSPGVTQQLDRAYPAHLHINVDERHRQRGIGRRLVESYLADLRFQSVAGVHLFCGADPLGFYHSLGFEVIETANSATATVFLLGLRL